jgi:hypothetical protein
MLGPRYTVIWLIYLARCDVYCAMIVSIGYVSDGIGINRSDLAMSNHVSNASRAQKCS